MPTRKGPAAAAANGQPGLGKRRAAESEDMNVHEVDGITLFGPLELELGSEIGSLVIHGKVVIDSES